jgi:GNAT superfamily N-acetyltransferase
MKQLNIAHIKKAEKLSQIVREFILENDSDFKPPLTARYEGSLDDTVEGYTKGKEIIYAEIKEIIGILTFTRGGTREPLASYCPCLYVNLIIIEDRCRNQGIAKKIYQKMIEEILPESNYDCAAGRTWKENKASRNAFRSAGFQEVCVSEDERRTNVYYVYCQEND